MWSLDTTKKRTLPFQEDFHTKKHNLAVEIVKILAVFSEPYYHYHAHKNVMQQMSTKITYDKTMNYQFSVIQDWTDDKLSCIQANIPQDINVRNQYIYSNKDSQSLNRVFYLYQGKWSGFNKGWSFWK